VSADPPNEEVPGAGLTVPIGGDWKAGDAGALCALADEPVDEEGVARRSTVAPSWIMHLRGSASRRLQ
jgi:hypothetical protein